LWLHSLKVAQLLRSAACLHTNQSRSYLNHLVVLFKFNSMMNSDLKNHSVFHSEFSKQQVPLRLKDLTEYPAIEDCGI